MEKMAKIKIDLDVAREMLGLAGFDYDKMHNATDDEVVEKVLSMIECYGATYEISENCADIQHQEHQKE